MKAPSSLSNDLRIVQHIRTALPAVIAIYHFGSSAHGTIHSESDVDLAVLPNQPLPTASRWELEQDLSIALHTDVDLVDLRAASTVMQMQVISQGEVLYESDTTARQTFEMQTYSAHALLNEERAAILRDIRERGRIYG